jgi:serine phosphatase RsbU (regulator of sigma subunit)
MRRAFDQWGDAMIDYRSQLRVEGTPRTSLPEFVVSSAVRSFDGGECCGDMVFVLPLDSGRKAIVVIDIAGHGLARAPLSSAIAEAINEALQGDASPSVALQRADELLQTFEDESPYAVAFVAVVHPAVRTVVYASAGHDVAFTLADDGRIRHLMPTAPMLGIPLRNHACDATFVLDPTETLVVATDGVGDSRPAGSDHFFGAGRTARAVARSLRSGTDPARAVLEAAYAHGGDYLADDAAAVIARSNDVLPPISNSTRLGRPCRLGASQHGEKSFNSC